MYVATVKYKAITEQKIKRLLELDISRFRINFARGDLEKNIHLLQHCRLESERFGKVCSIFADLPGKKIRVGKFQQSTIHLKKGQFFKIDRNMDRPGNTRRVYCEDNSFFIHAEVKDTILLSDGESSLTISHKERDELICVAQQDCVLYNHCGISIKGKYIQSTELTDQDRYILSEINGIVDYVCPSFVDHRSVIDDVLSNMPNRSARIIAKIESPIGINNLDDILQSADGAMLCRGDLKSFYTHEQMRELSILIRESTKSMSKTLIFATDYFEGMLTGANLDAEQLCHIQFAISMNPDFIILNETAYGKHWHSIAKYAMSLL